VCLPVDDAIDALQGAVLGLGRRHHLLLPCLVPFLLLLPPAVSVPVVSPVASTVAVTVVVSPVVASCPAVAEKGRMGGEEEGRVSACREGGKEGGRGARTY